MVEGSRRDLAHDRTVGAGQLDAAVARARVDHDELDLLPVAEPLVGDRAEAAPEILAPVLDGDHDRDRHRGCSAARRRPRAPARAAPGATRLRLRRSRDPRCGRRRTRCPRASAAPTASRSTSRRSSASAIAVGVQRSQLERAVLAEDRLGADPRQLDAGQPAGEHLLGHQREVRQRQAQPDGRFGVEPGELRGAEHAETCS